MSAFVDFAWRVYQHSPPLLITLFGVMVAAGWRYHVQPWLEELEDVQDNHADDIQQKALNGAERDVMLENAHERLDEHDDLHQQAEEARASLRERITRLERREAWRSGDDGGGPPPIGPGNQRLSADGGDQQLRTDGSGGSAASQARARSDDDVVDLTLNIDVDGDGYVHVETAPQRGEPDGWLKDAAPTGDQRD